MKKSKPSARSARSTSTPARKGTAAARRRPEAAPKASRSSRSTRQPPPLRLEAPVEWGSGDRQGILCVPSTGRLFKLDAGGRRLVEALEKGADRQALVALQQRHHPEVDVDRLALDVDAFLIELAREGLLRRDAL